MIRGQRARLFILAILLLAPLSCGSSDDDGGGGSNVANPQVEGPIPGAAFVNSTSFDLAPFGYLQEEYFLAGTANAYVNVGELDSDGDWTVEPGAAAAYKTRIVVYRPIATAAFNGTVIVEWLNVSAGLDAAPDWTSAHTELLREGYAWVGVSAQLVGVEGGGSIIPGLPDLSLKRLNPERYGSLSHPGDSFSYDMFSQAGQAVRNPGAIDPLGGLIVERIIAVGESQSAFRLTTYVNAIHPVARLFDGFLIHSRGGGSAPLAQAPLEGIATPQVVRVRGDLDVPVLTFQTETDLISLRSFPDRQDDSPLFRLWEVAGTSHADTYTLTVGGGDRGDDPDVANVLYDVDKPIPGVIECAAPINSGPQHWVLKAAIAALNRWVETGEAPASAPRLEVAGSPPAFVLDALGNVRGGIRTPYVDAPTAVLSGLGQGGAGFCFLFGTTVRFDASLLADLYPDHAAYVAAVNESTDRAVADGFLLAADAALIKTAAENSDIGGL